MSPAIQKKKIVILGGGMGAITAAFELTNSDALCELHDVTIYQLGWRLGGKGASGRKSVDGAQRIQEHGLHILMGCYENAFYMLRQCYKELDRPHGTPLQTIRDAFKPQNQVVAEQLFDDTWQQWNFEFPEDKTWYGRLRYPGKNDAFPSALVYIKRLFDWLIAWLKKFETKQHLHTHFHAVREILHIYLDELDNLQTPENSQRTVKSEQHDALHHKLLNLRSEVRQELSGIAKTELLLYRIFLLLDLGLTCLIGIFKYDLFFNSYDSINHFDFREWLADCGGADETVNSPIVTVLYELVFAYENGVSIGDEAVPNLEAGTIMRAIPHMMFGYTGAFMWKMQSSMGDTIFAPMYQVLKRRGVKFKFFHKVTNLNVEEDSLVSVDVVEQVKLNSDEYDPLFPVTVDGFEHPLPAWPAEPLYQQICEGNRLKSENINLESFYTPWLDAGEPKTLRAGEDFDTVVLGISIGSFPYLCNELVEQNARWSKMVDTVKTVQTQAAQFWMKPSFTEMGFTKKGAVVGSFLPSSMDTWADMTYLLNDEGWPSNTVNALAYFTGPMPGPAKAPPADTPEFPEQAAQQVKKVVSKLIDDQAGSLWPDYPGEHAIISRYLRANIDPSERYVMSVKNSSKHRLKAGDSQFKNLVLAGDWTDCRINMGCVEAATISGMQASKKICGYPKKIVLYKNRIL